MASAADHVYLDTGDLLVTGRRVAFEGVSVPLAGVTSARVERRTEWVNAGRPRPGVRLVLAAMAWMAVGYAGVSASLYTYIALRPNGTWLAFALLAGVMAVHISGCALLRRRRGPPQRRAVEWPAVVLTTAGRDVELFRTRSPSDAEAAVEAVGRAVADLQSRDLG